MTQRMTIVEYHALLNASPQEARQKKHRKHEEYDHQKTFFDWCELHAPQFPVLDEFFAVPNAAKRGVLDRKMMLDTGLKAGVCDVFNLNSNGQYKGLVFEFKSSDGKVSPAQKIWIARFRKSGHRVEIPRTWIEAARITVEYFGLTELEKEVL